jgi:hypothetical protein
MQSSPYQGGKIFGQQPGLTTVSFDLRGVLRHPVLNGEQTGRRGQEGHRRAKDRGQATPAKLTICERWRNNLASTSEFGVNSPTCFFSKMTDTPLMYGKIKRWATTTA